MSRVIDLSSRRDAPVSVAPLVHPAGIRLQFDRLSSSAYVTPEVRAKISVGSYSADLVRLLSGSICPGERALVIGAGLGVVSSLIALSGAADRVLAVEADPGLISHLEHVHALNGVPWVETLHTVLTRNLAGRARFVRWLGDAAEGKTAMVPCMDLNLILREEAISLIVCDIPGTSTRLIAQADLGTVKRILIETGDRAGSDAACNQARAALTAKGFESSASGSVLVFERRGAVRGSEMRRTGPGKAVNM